MFPLTLPSPPLGERDVWEDLRWSESLSPGGGEGRVRGSLREDAQRNDLG
jgi:hypothetical protein